MFSPQQWRGDDEEATPQAHLERRAGWRSPGMAALRAEDDEADSEAKEETMTILIKAILWIGGLVVLAVFAAGAFFLISLAIVMPSPAYAEDPYADADPARKQWFESLTYPCPWDGEQQCSCCGAGDATQLSEDQVEQRGTEWWIDLSGNGEFEQVPPDRVIENPPSIDGQAYIFTRSSGQFLCFVPLLPLF